MAHVFLEGLLALSPVDVPRVEEVSIDVTVLLFALGLAVVSTCLFGLVPALHVSRLDVSEVLKRGGSKGTVSGGGGRMQSALVVAEIALSIVLLVTAGLLLRSFQVLHQTPLGFTTERVLVAHTKYPASNDEGYRRRTLFYRDVIARMRTLPGVNAAAGVEVLPLGPENVQDVEYLVQGKPLERPGQRPTAELQVVTPEYFATMRIPILQGRDFAETDQGKPEVAIINKSLARAAFAGESPIGRRVQIHDAWMEIVGVVGDTRSTAPSTPAPPQVFASATQGAGGSLSILIRTAADEGALANTFRTIVHEMEPTVPVRFETMDDLYAEALAYPRFRSQLLGAFAGIAMLLAAVGIFSVLAHLVGQRTEEMAIRLAMGAQPSHLVGLVVSQGLRLVAIGIVLGLAGAFAVTRLLQGVLYEVSPFDIRAYFGAIALLGLVSMLAIILPALKAVRIEPLEVLRQG
jgi:putative ABC transport system permease protein